MNLTGKKILLGSKSPRRQQLLNEMGLSFTVDSIDTDETYPTDLTNTQIPVYLAIKKAKPFEKKLKIDEILITADTIVCIDEEVLGKPKDKKEATEILLKLSGKEHQVITGVCLKSIEKQVSFYTITRVYFKELNLDEINYYIDHYQPYDKAGAYGIQEWIGFIGIHRIDGSFYNVMGLPVQKLYEELSRF